MCEKRLFKDGVLDSANTCTFMAGVVLLIRLGLAFCLAQNSTVLYHVTMRVCMVLTLLSTASLAARPTLSEMKRDLQHAEKELQIAYSKVLHLRETIAKKEIARIKQDISEFEGNDEEKLDFLDLNRKNISSIMNEVPSCIQDAQEVLDVILIAITDLKEPKLYGS